MKHCLYSWVIHTGLTHYVSCSLIFWTNSVPVEYRNLIKSVNAIIDNVHKRQNYATKVLREQHINCLCHYVSWIGFSMDNF